jgi:hypothetical protein
MLHLFSGRIGQAWLYNPLLFSALAIFFAVVLTQMLFARTVRIRLSRRERKIAWLLAIALFSANWVYVILYVG